MHRTLCDIMSAQDLIKRYRACQPYARSECMYDSNLELKYHSYKIKIQTVNTASIQREYNKSVLYATRTQAHSDTDRRLPPKYMKSFFSMSLSLFARVRVALSLRKLFFFSAYTTNGPEEIVHKFEASHNNILLNISCVLFNKITLFVQTVFY